MRLHTVWHVHEKLTVAMSTPNKSTVVRISSWTHDRASMRRKTLPDPSRTAPKNPLQSLMWPAHLSCNAGRRRPCATIWINFLRANSISTNASSSSESPTLSVPTTEPQPSVGRRPWHPHSTPDTQVRCLYLSGVRRHHN